jgi:hypothetical protein
MFKVTRLLARTLEVAERCKWASEQPQAMEDILKFEECMVLKRHAKVTLTEVEPAGTRRG